MSFYFMMYKSISSYRSDYACVVSCLLFLINTLKLDHLQFIYHVHTLIICHIIKVISSQFISLFEMVLVVLVMLVYELYYSDYVCCFCIAIREFDC